jgi:hypothetical protein
MVAAAAIGAAATVAGGAISASGASSAAGAQSSAANNASAQNLAQFQLNYNTEHPFVDLGYNAANHINDMIYSGEIGQRPWEYDVAANYLNKIPNAPQPMTQAQLEQTPGYQFNLSQGLKAAQSAAAAKGLGVSGAALKGAATYATGLADSTYQNQFNNAQQIYQDLFQNAQQGYNGFMNLGQADLNLRNQRYNNLLGAASLGQNAAAQVGNQGVQSAANSGNFLTQAGNAQAAGQVGTANALSGSLTGLANQYQQYQLLNNLFGGSNNLANGFNDAAARSGGSMYSLGSI